MKPIYLDYNATTPVDQAVAGAMLPYLSGVFGNPSSSHFYGREAHKAVEKARKQVALLLGCHSDEVIFTSGGTESNNMAIKGVCFANQKKGNHIIISEIEHPAVKEVCDNLLSRGFRFTQIPVDKYGIIVLKELEKAISADTILISVMHANNEVGSIQPIKQIAKLAMEQGIVFHTDAAQSVGKIAVNVNELGVDLLSLAGHKLYAPKGIGVLYCRKGTLLEKFMHGANHENNMRAGTENVAGIAGLGVACEQAASYFTHFTVQVKQLRDLLYDELKKGIPELVLNGNLEHCLPNTLNVCLPGIHSESFLASLKNVAASAGAACHAGETNISDVLKAMKIDPELAKGAIRLSLGRFTTKDEVVNAANEIISHYKKERKTEKKNVLMNGLKDFGLLQFAVNPGCSCKISSETLSEMLKGLGRISDANILVGKENNDDAAVVKISDEMAIVQTIDFFSPVVDDPYTFGLIAAANSLSDIYAMGATPLFALNVLAYPENSIPPEIICQMLKGAEDKAAEAGISIIGGHSVDDSELKYGLVVSGLIKPGEEIKNKGAQPGDILVLTKKIGTGIMINALKADMLTTYQEKLLIDQMCMLNSKTAEMMKKFKVNACTDISGFGLLGHLNEMLKASMMDAEIYFNQISLLDGLTEVALENTAFCKTRRDEDSFIEYADEISEFEKNILFDPQTSGGLLMCLNSNDAKLLINELQLADIECSLIGKIVGKGNGKIVVIK